MRDLPMPGSPETSTTWPVPVLARATTQEQVDLVVAANQWAQSRSAQRLEPACDDTRSQHLPAADRLLAVGGFDCPELAVLEQVADQTPRRRLDRHRVGLRR